MLNKLRTKKRGFTLLELIVVIVVLGVIAGLAVPTFLSVTTKSREQVAVNEAKAFARDVKALAAFTTGADASAWTAEADGETAGSYADGTYTASNGCTVAVTTSGDDVTVGAVSCDGAGAPTTTTTVAQNGQATFAAANVSYDASNSYTYPASEPMPAPTFLDDYRGGWIDQSANEVVITVVNGSSMLDAVWDPGFLGASVGSGNGYMGITVSTRTNSANSGYTDIVFTYESAAYNMYMVSDLPSGDYSLLRFTVPVGTGATVTGYYSVVLTPSSGSTLFTL